MNIIDLRPLRIVMSGNQAFLLPLGNGRHPGYLVLPHESAVVPFHGCLCSECVKGLNERCIEAVQILMDRGFAQVHMEASKFEVPPWFQDESGFEVTCQPHTGSEWAMFYPQQRDVEEPPAGDNKAILRWLLQQQDNLLGDEGRSVRVDWIVTLAEMLVPEWNPVKFMQLIDRQKADAFSGGALCEALQAELPQ